MNRALVVLGVVAALAAGVWFGTALGTRAGTAKLAMGLAEAPAGTEARSAGFAGGASDVLSSADKALAAPLEAADLPRPDRKIIRNGAIGLEVDACREREREAAAVVAAAGGFLFSSSSAKTDEGYERISIEARVPAAAFDGAMEKLSALGRLRSRSVSSEDVTEEYVDVEARIRNLETARERVRRILERSGKIAEVLEVERELARIQGEIEQAQGRMRYLKDRVAFSTIRLELFEKGAVSLETAVEWRYGRMVRRIVRALLLTLRAVAAVATAVAIFAVVWVPLLAAALALRRRALRRRPPA